MGPDALEDLAAGSLGERLVELPEILPESVGEILLSLVDVLIEQRDRRVHRSHDRVHLIAHDGGVRRLDGPPFPVAAPVTVIMMDTAKGAPVAAASTSPATDRPIPSVSPTISQPTAASLRARRAWMAFTSASRVATPIS